MMFAIVQHSGTQTSHAEFERGLEQRSVTKSEALAVIAAGGIVFEDYGEADDFCYAEQYPPGYMGLIPTAPGRFSSKKLHGLRIYIPSDMALKASLTAMYNRLVAPEIEHIAAFQSILSAVEDK